MLNTITDPNFTIDLDFWQHKKGKVSFKSTRKSNSELAEVVRDTRSEVNKAKV